MISSLDLPGYGPGYVFGSDMGKKGLIFAYFKHLRGHHSKTGGRGAKMVYSGQFATGYKAYIFFAKWI